MLATEMMLLNWLVKPVVNVNMEAQTEWALHAMLESALIKRWSCHLLHDLQCLMGSELRIDVLPIDGLDSHIQVPDPGFEHLQVLDR